MPTLPMPAGAHANHHQSCRCSEIAYDLQEIRRSPDVMRVLMRRRVNIR